MTPEMLIFLKSNAWSDFYNSVLTQFYRRGHLTPNQQRAVSAAMLRATTPREAMPPREFSIKPGQRIEVKAWIARRLATDLKMSVFFRNLEIAEVLKESAKAYQVRVKFVAQIVTSCHVCGRDLDTEVSRATGIGPVCADKLGLPRPTLATAKQTLEALDALCGNIGIVGPIWVPKSQIKGHADE